MTTQKIMLCVIIAMLPALVASVIIFGLRALLMTVICCAACVLFEWVTRKIMKRENTIGDLSAIVTGMLLSFNLPVTLPFYMAVIGCFVAIVIVKQFFGGIGQNFANPAITGRIVLMLSFTSYMTSWAEPFYYQKGGEIITTSTPLAGGEAKLLDLFLGTTGGSLGETCALALLIGGVFLVAMRIISPATPLCFIGTVFLLSLVGSGDVMTATAAILSGGVMLGAIFMATDYATTPLTLPGKIIFGIGCGLITMLIRSFGTMPEGVSYSILLMNILTPIIDRLTVPKAFGAVDKKKGAHHDK
ncbi:MAG: RnfABCDGE type electron transport complex subunit D [Eubacterium sp.]|nr:RnfABCDGE type electron transport complex subunit D [Eubacterium sp.]